MRTIVWFRGKDLRVDDHGPLNQALADGDVIPLFVLDPYFFSAERAQHLPHRMQFLLEALEALDSHLRELGSRLILVPGRSVDLMPSLAERWRADRVLAHRWSEPFGAERDGRIARALAKAGIGFHAFEGETLVAPGTVRAGTGSMFQVFTPFARAFHRQAVLEEPLRAPRSLPAVPDLEIGGCEIPTLADLGLERNPRLLRGGEGMALARMKAFLEDGLAGYRTSRDRMGEEGTSRLSADLHFGTLSIRTLWQAVSERVPENPEDSACFLNELLWREFAHHLLALEPRLLEHPFRSAFKGFPWHRDEAAWEAWAGGRTGYPVVDAAARQLLSDGFVHNRARMVAACFLAKHLLLDYRVGEAHYLKWLVDGDWANNNLGWQWSAGCGVDAQPWFRVFNPIAQGERFDPDGTYVKRWLPELASLPARWVHRPWEAPAGIRPEDYPPPFVEAGAARARFLETAQRHLKGPS